jgi:ATP-dependent helicase HrpA
MSAVLVGLKRVLCGCQVDFPFMSPPDARLLESSVATLRQMGCLEPDRAVLTLRGTLFRKLEFDPRLSYFVSLAHREHGLLAEAAVIAAILAAPGR